MERKTDWAGHSMESTYGPGPPFSKHLILPFLTLNQAVLCVHRWRRSSASLWSFAMSTTHGSWMWPMSSSCRRTNTRRLLASMIPSSKRTMTRYLSQYNSHCISQLGENKQKICHLVAAFCLMMKIHQLLVYCSVCLVTAVLLLHTTWFSVNWKMMCRNLCMHRQLFLPSLRILLLWNVKLVHGSGIFHVHFCFCVCMSQKLCSSLYRSKHMKGLKELLFQWMVENKSANFEGRPGPFLEQNSYSTNNERNEITLHSAVRFIPGGMWAWGRYLGTQV